MYDSITKKERISYFWSGRGFSHFIGAQKGTSGGLYIGFKAQKCMKSTNNGKTTRKKFSIKQGGYLLMVPKK